MGKKIDTSISPVDWVPMKYWAMGSTMSPEQKRDKLDFLIQSHQYIYSEKKDGNWSRAIVDDGYGILQSRTVSCGRPMRLYLARRGRNRLYEAVRRVA